jgi:hypothetical protein
MSDIFDDLGNTNFSDVDTSYPVLVPDNYEWEITGAEVKTSDKTGGRYIEVKCSLVSPNAKSLKGTEVNAGYQVTHILALTPTEKFSADAIKANIARFMDAVLGRREWDPTLQAYLKQRFWAKTGVQKETTGEDGTVYPAKTVIKQFVPKA